jgi:hypothetical protein
MGDLNIKAFAKAGVMRNLRRMDDQSIALFVNLDSMSNQHHMNRRNNQSSRIQHTRVKPQHRFNL